MFLCHMPLFFFKSGFGSTHNSKVSKVKDKN